MLHLIILSGQYHMRFLGNKDLNQVIDCQWNIKDHNQWKHNEIWPCEVSTMMTDSGNRPRAWFACNPDTDKHDWLLNKFLETFLPIFLTNYSDIKDPSWPDIYSLDDFDNLPEEIRQECMETFGLYIPKHLSQLKTSKKIWVYTDAQAQNELSFYKKAYIYTNYQGPKKTISCVEFQNRMVDCLAVAGCQASDCVLYLQDVVNNPATLVTAGLINSVNPKQLELIQHWKSLHPRQMLLDIGIAV